MVVCKKWPKYYKLKTAKSSTHPQRYHLKSQHSMDLSTARSLQKQPNKQKTLSAFVDKESQQQMYAELAAFDLTGTIARNAKSRHQLYCFYKAEDQPQ